MTNRRQICQNIAEISKAMENAESINEYRKLQCIYLGDTNPKMTAKEIGKITQYTPSSVNRIFAEFRKNGMDSIKDNRGGRHRAYLNLEEEGEILSQFDEICEAGEMCEASRIKIAYEEKVGKKVNDSTIYRMMARHNFRKIVPYQRHKKGNIEEQESFKKTSKAR